MLAHGTLANMDDNWQAASPILANHGYCVFAFNYGGASPSDDFQGTGDIGASAGQLVSFVNEVLAATGASKVDFAGHSQGGMMRRYYIDFPGGASKAGKPVALAVVTSYTNAFLLAGPNVTNITLQNQCPLDGSDHLEIASDPVAMADMLNALHPAQPVRVPCLLVLPVAGPVGPAPSF